MEEVIGSCVVSEYVMSLRAAPVLLLIAVASLPLPAIGQAVLYNPYADSQDQLPPVAPDGTIRWGVFYKSAAMQNRYEQLWSMGACRGTNKAITIPVAENRLVVDSLPEEEFSGIVRGAAGTIAGGMVAFVGNLVAPADEPPLIAQLHPAGVSRVVVTGESSAAILRPGMTVRLSVVVDSRGRVAAPVKTFEIISPSHAAAPFAIAAGRQETVVATVTRVQRGELGLQVATGRIRKLAASIAPDAVATVDADGLLELIAAGDAIEVKGRRWTGEGSMGAGTVFASDVRIRKTLR